jgi:hypothetical protein
LQVEAGGGGGGVGDKNFKGVRTEVMMMVMMMTTLERMMAMTTVTIRDCSEGVWWFLRCVFVAVGMRFVKFFFP